MALNFVENRNGAFLPHYYKKLFPSLQFYRWLSYGSADIFSKREISFTLSSGGYIRFQSFDTHEEFLHVLHDKNPAVIDIGAIYLTKPKEKHRLTKLSPIAKEMVFDIDITDYDDIRICCSGTEVCTRCWQFVVIASKIIDSALREDLSFKHILWVFSGRRGIHGWVCDERARNLSDEARLSIAKYLQVIGSSQYIGNKVQLPENVPPSLKRALSIINIYFIESIVKDQDILGTDEKLNNFLEKIDDSIRALFKDNMTKVPSSVQRWEVFEWTLADLQSKDQITMNLRNLKEELQLYYSYARLDIAISTNIGHLLKSPFCVHRETGKICIPFDVKFVDNFNPNNVPTITRIVRELKAYNTKIMNQEAAEIQDYEKTSLLEPISLFMTFLNDLENIKVENVEMDSK